MNLKLKQDRWSELKTTASHCSLTHFAENIKGVARCCPAAEGISPGVAGQAGTEQRVSDGDGDKVLVEPAVHQAVWHGVVPVAHGTT